ncbi:hypothetical protein AArcCO_2694 [Halalkaliarchaeum sp. AArc-CO]|nr:hypothetical protein AArcCO_2694 [Halalkaliarchaeum sp. AArc-CO]
MGLKGAGVSANPDPASTAAKRGAQPRSRESRRRGLSRWSEQRPSHVFRLDRTFPVRTTETEDVSRTRPVPIRRPP